MLAHAQSSQGNWTLRLGTTSTDFVSGAVTDAAGDLYICGGTFGSLYAPNPGNDFNSFLAKYDASGHLNWANQVIGFGGAPGSTDGGGKVAVDSAGNAYVAVSGAVAKYNAAGAIQWQTGVGAKTSGITVDNSGNVFVTGITSGNFWGTDLGGTDACLVKINPSGEVAWGHQFGTPNFDFTGGVAVDSHGNPIAVGWTDSWGAPYWDSGFVTKFDAAGNLQWNKQIGPSGIANTMSEAAGVAVDSHDNLLVSGWANQSLYGEPYNSNVFGWLIQLDVAGNKEWISRAGGYFDRLIVDPVGGEYVLDIYSGVMRFDSSWTLVFGSPTPLVGMINTDMALGNGRVYVVGDSHRGTGGDDSYDFWVASILVAEPSDAALLTVIALVLAAGAAVKRQRRRGPWQLRPLSGEAGIRPSVYAG